MLTANLSRAFFSTRPSGARWSSSILCCELFRSSLFSFGLLFDKSPTFLTRCAVWLLGFTPRCPSLPLTVKVTHVMLLTALFYEGESLNRNTATRSECIRTASRHRCEQEKEELQQTILKAAGALFLEQGYDRFSMRRLAQEIGYSDATLYLSFRNKDDLLFTVVEKAFSKG